MNLPLEICFKGGRAYIHGTDMLNAAFAAVVSHTGTAEVQRLNFMINRMTRNNVALELAPDVRTQAIAEGRPVAALSFELAEVPWYGTLVETAGEPVCRYPYDEGLITTQCRVNQGERSVVRERGAEFTPIEVIVAMTKVLHQTLFPEAPGKWVFCRWEAKCWPLPDTSGVFRITLTQAIGTRLTKSDVVFAGDRVGCIYFSAKEGL